MTEIIYNITASAGREIVLSGLTNELGKDNILGIINKTTGKVLYTPLKYTHMTAVYSDGTLTITLDSTVEALGAGDQVFVKCYTDSDSTASLQTALQGNDTTATLTAILAALQSSEEETPEELPAGLADRVMLLLQHFGIAGSYEAEAKGGERTNNTVIDECKVLFQDAFNGLLPTGFTMPNSVTVDNLTYTGTTNS